MHKSRFEQALTLSHVPRWSIVDMRKEQSVADHTYRTQIIAVEIGDRIHNIYPSMNIHFGRMLMLSLFHDVHEGVSGDMPTPYKRELERKFAVTFPDPIDVDGPMERAVVHMADALEAKIFLSRYGYNMGRAKVMQDMEEHVAKTEAVLIDTAITTYNRNMPGMDREGLVTTMTAALMKIVADITAIGISYE